MTPSNTCTTVMTIPRNAIAMRQRMRIAIRTVSNKATLREAAYRAKLSSLPGPSRPTREKPELTPALRSVVSAQLQNRFVIESPFVVLILEKSAASVLQPGLYELRAMMETARFTARNTADSPRLDTAGEQVAKRSHDRR